MIKEFLKLFIPQSLINKNDNIHKNEIQQIR